MESDIQSQMIVVLLSPANNVHTLRWANGLSAVGVKIHVISQHAAMSGYSPEVVLHILSNRGGVGYFSMVPAVKKLLRAIRPKLVNAHYASGYATTARLVNFKPWLLSVWGSDVYLFPYKSFLHKWWLIGTLKSATAVASTSNAMAAQVRCLLPDIGHIHITPFGVDLSLFNNVKKNSCSNIDVDDCLVVGTVKSLAHCYGIDVLIKTFSILYFELYVSHPEIAKKLRLRIVGDGPDLLNLKKLVEFYKISMITTFVGKVRHSNVLLELKKIDIYVALSRSESFGVAVIEASAASLPVVVSDVGGLPEVVKDGVTGYIVKDGNPDVAAHCIKQLVLSPEMRESLGSAGRQFVAINYEWDVSVQKMINVYEGLLLVP